MTGSSHTPGPWMATGDLVEVSGTLHWSGDILPAGDGLYRGPIAHILSCNHFDGITREEARANAQLIAAAPQTAIECARHRAHNAALVTLMQEAIDRLEELDAPDDDAVLARMRSAILDHALILMGAPTPATVESAAALAERETCARATP